MTEKSNKALEHQKHKGNSVHEIDNTWKKVVTTLSDDGKMTLEYEEHLKKNWTRSALIILANHLDECKTVNHRRLAEELFKSSSNPFWNIWAFTVLLNIKKFDKLDQTRLMKKVLDSGLLQLVLEWALQCELDYNRLKDKLRETWNERVINEYPEKFWLKKEK